ncbi:MAG: hypothetical protein ABIS14_03870 [Sphingomonas sp.]
MSLTLFSTPRRAFRLDPEKAATALPGARKVASPDATSTPGCRIYGKLTLSR